MTTELKLNKRQRRALNKLDWYLKQRRNLVLSDPVVRAAIFERIDRLTKLANQLEVDDSPTLGLGGAKVYAWDVIDTAWELRFLFNELKS